MGVNQSIDNNNNNVDFNKKLYIVMDLYLNPKFEDTQNFDIDNYKTNILLKRAIKDIIMNSLFNKFIRSISLLEHNILLISKIDRYNVKYLEMNIMLEFNDVIEIKPKIDIIQTPLSTYIQPNEILNNHSHNITIQIIKMNIVNEIFKYISNKNAILTNDISLIISHQTLHNIDIYQK